MMDRVQNPSNSGYCAPLSETFVLYLKRIATICSNGSIIIIIITIIMIIFKC
jgi:hypothetical protein